MIGDVPHMGDVTGVSDIMEASQGVSNAPHDAPMTPPLVSPVPNLHNI